MAEMEGRVFSADGVELVRFERDGGVLRNVDPFTLGSGDFLTIGEAGTFTLKLQSAPVPPEIVDWFYGQGT
jgi:hypothetical protein